MSEENEVDRKLREFQESQNAGAVKPYGPHGPTVHIKIDKSKAMKDLEEENEDLKSKLTIVAEEKFNERKQELEQEGKKLGYNFEIESPSELKAYEKLVSKKPSSREIPLQNQLNYPRRNPNNEGVPLGDRQYNDMAEMFNDLNAEHDKGNKEATRILAELSNRAKHDLETGKVFEFQGKLLSEGENEKNKWKRIR